MKDNKCVNTLPLCVNSVTGSSHNCVPHIMGDGLVNQAKNGLANVHVSLAVEMISSQGLSAVTSDELMNTSRGSHEFI